MEYLFAAIALIVIAALAAWVLTLFTVPFWLGFLASLFCVLLGFFSTAFLD